MNQENQSKRCSCGLNNKITCPNCSELKMVILLRTGNNDLKIKTSGGKNVNPVWYNHLSKNRKKANILVNAMFRRFEKSKYANATNKVNFYSNITGDLVTSIKV